MARPPMPVGTWGNINIAATPGGKYRARAYFRDLDGRTREVSRVGRSKGAARSALTAAMADRMTPADADITASARLRVAAGVWLAEKETERDAGKLAVNTVRRYTEVLTDHVLPGLGELTIAECTVTRLDAFLKHITSSVGAPTARLCRTVLSGVMGLAVRHGGAASNPIRDVAAVVVAKPQPRALSAGEVKAVRQAITDWQFGTPAKGKARRGRPPTQDLLDIVDLLLATGARIGEVLALRWTDDVDLDQGVITISGTIITGTDGKLTRQGHPKNGSEWRRLTLPRFALDALMRRRVAVVVPNSHDVVFPSAAGTLRDPGSVRKQITKVLDPVGLGWVTPHSFRRTIATVIDRASDTRTAASQLGHAGTDVTLRHYVQRINDAPDVRAALDAFMTG